jgi:hypothetical protein
MRNLIDKLIKSYALEDAPVVTPSTQRLIDTEKAEDDHELSSSDRDKFITIVMTLLFVGRFTRPDILFSVTVLSTKLKVAFQSDMQEALRIVRYLKGTSNIGLIFTARAALVLKFFVDASHGLLNGRGFGAFIAILGSAPIAFRCWMLKFVTLSSAESEICALTEAVTYILWLRALLKELNIEQTSATEVYQDNMSAIQMQIDGHGTFKRSKHLLVKASFCFQHIHDKSIVLTYLPTKEMICDMLSKVLNGPALRRNMIGASLG